MKTALGMIVFLASFGLICYGVGLGWDWLKREAFTGQDDLRLDRASRHLEEHPTGFSDWLKGIGG